MKLYSHRKCQSAYCLICDAKLDAAGFTNVELIDLDDSEGLFWIDGKIEAISVGSDTLFESTDWFDPDTNVVISYH